MTIDSKYNRNVWASVVAAATGLSVLMIGGILAEQYDLPEFLKADTGEEKFLYTLGLIGTSTLASTIAAYTIFYRATTPKGIRFAYEH